MKVLLVLLLCSVGFAAEFTPQKINPSGVRIVPVRPTPEPDNVQTTIVFPKEEQVLAGNPVNVQVRLRGFPIGTLSDFDRAKEIYNDPNGQSLLIFIDDYHPFEIYKSFVDSLDQNNLFFDLTLNKDIPYELKEGIHVIRAFPDRSYGESLKRPGCYDASVFYIGKKENAKEVNLKAPYLTYNEPLETLRYNEKQPILLDFYLSNTQLSRDGYKVRVIINDTITRILTLWAPYYIYGIPKGQHTIQLQLLNPKNEVEPGMFNDVKRTITVD